MKKYILAITALLGIQSLFAASYNLEGETVYSSTAGYPNNSGIIFSQDNQTFVVDSENYRVWTFNAKDNTIDNATVRLDKNLNADCQMLFNGEYKGTGITIMGDGTLTQNNNTEWAGAFATTSATSTITLDVDFNYVKAKTPSTGGSKNTFITTGNGIISFNKNFTAGVDQYGVTELRLGAVSGVNSTLSFGKADSETKYAAEISGALNSMDGSFNLTINKNYTVTAGQINLANKSGANVITVKEGASLNSKITTYNDGATSGDFNISGSTFTNNGSISAENVMNIQSSAKFTNTGAISAKSIYIKDCTFSMTTGSIKADNIVFNSTNSQEITGGTLNANETLQVNGIGMNLTLASGVNTIAQTISLAGNTNGETDATLTIAGTADINGVKAWNDCVINVTGTLNATGTVMLYHNTTANFNGTLKAAQLNLGESKDSEGKITFVADANLSGTSTIGTLNIGNGNVNITGGTHNISSIGHTSTEGYGSLKISNSTLILGDTVNATNVKGTSIGANTTFNLTSNLVWNGKLVFEDGALLKLDMGENQLEVASLSGDIAIDFLNVESWDFTSFFIQEITEAEVKDITFYINGSQISSENIEYIAEGSGYFVNFTQIPEPSTYAIIAGILALGLAVYRKRK